jgi:hypothetical protein
MARERERDTERERGASTYVIETPLSERDR